VHRFAVTTNRETQLMRDPNQQWKNESGDEPVNQVNVESFLSSLTKLRAVRWIGGEMPKQAFDQIQITIVFTTSLDDKTTHKLVVGGPAGDGMWYGRVEGRPGVFVLPNPDFNALRLPLVSEGATPASSASPSPAASPQ
jgi:hypothetical protein